MIFKSKLQEIGPQLRQEINRLLNLAITNQTHNGDVLLIQANGFYNPEVLNFQGKKLNPHVIGPGDEGWADQTHYFFIHAFRTKYTSEMSLKEYEASTSEEERAYLIQLEMLIYLKFWESDLIVKRLCQLTRIAHGESYDWYFKIGDKSRDPNNRGTREQLWNKSIKDRLSSISPMISTLISEAYNVNIRNAIAHSSYAIIGNVIQFHDRYNGKVRTFSMSFKDWYDIFVKSILLHNEYIGMNETIREHYAEFIRQNRDLMTIRITELNNEEYELPVVYNDKIGQWSYQQ